MTKSDNHEPSRLDRRGVFRGATMLGATGLLAPAGLFRALAAPSPQDPPPIPGAKRALESRTQHILRWTEPNPADWVPPRADADHNVVIVGGGQTGVSLGYGLARNGVGRVQIIDQAEPGNAGIWRNVARMRQLRTPKTLPGPAQGNAGLVFRAWYETLHGPAAFDALDRVPRLAWADYLDWFQQVTGTQVRYRTRLLGVEPAGDLLGLHLESGGVQRIETTRKLVLANGYMGAGGGEIPDFIRKLPTRVWTHTEVPIDFAPLAGKVVGVLGAGASAFDAAATALEHGAAQVHLFSRKSYINYTNTPNSPPPPPPSAAPWPRLGVDPDHLALTDLAHTLPDVVRWRNRLIGDRVVATVPLDSLNRAVSSDRFYLHVNSPWNDVAVDGDGKVAVKTPSDTFHFDYVIAGTGYRVDLSAQPELASVHDTIAIWRDHFQPGPGEANAALGIYPYLGDGLRFLPREGTGADYVRNIHCANLAASLSYGIPVGDVASISLQPQLIAAISRDLFASSVDVATSARQLAATPPAAPDPAPYQRAVR
jgi:FAD-dependent urate hydroxylase